MSVARLMVPPSQCPPGNLLTATGEATPLRTHNPTIVQAWLEMIGTPERARRLLGNWTGDPEEVLLGKRQAELAYAYAPYRQALDNWDIGHTTRRDLVIWAKYVASGKYKGPHLQRFLVRTAPTPSPELSWVTVEACLASRPSQTPQ